MEELKTHIGAAELSLYSAKNGLGSIDDYSTRLTLESAINAIEALKEALKVLGNSATPNG